MPANPIPLRRKGFLCFYLFYKKRFWFYFHISTYLKSRQACSSHCNLRIGRRQCCLPKSVRTFIYSINRRCCWVILGASVAVVIMFTGLVYWKFFMPMPPPPGYGYGSPPGILPNNQPSICFIMPPPPGYDQVLSLSYFVAMKIIFFCWKTFYLVLLVKLIKFMHMPPPPGYGPQPGIFPRLNSNITPLLLDKFIFCCWTKSSFVAGKLHTLCCWFIHICQVK